MVTDDAGLLIAVNPAFCAITGYDEDEVLGKNPRLLNSGRHAPGFYKLMWTAIASDGAWQVRSGIDEKAARSTPSG